MKKFSFITKKHSVNNMSNNMVDEDVQSMLLPLNLMQYIMFCPKYRIKNNCIIPHNLISNIISTVATLVFISIFVYRSYMVSMFKDYFGITTFMYFISYFDCIYYSFGFAINFVVGLISTKKSIKFILTIQKVHRILNDETNFRRFVILNWTFVLVTLGGYVFVFTYFCTQLSFVSMFNGYLLVFFDLNIVCAIRIFNLLEDKVILWNIQISCSQDIEIARDPSYSNKLFQAYVDLLECYEIHRVCVQQFMLYYIIEVFIHSLIYIQVAIDMQKTDMILNVENAASVASTSICFWMTKDLLLQTMMCQRCEKFYIAIQSVQDTCALVLKTTSSDDEKKLCKNVLRFHRASFSKVRACGLFYVDAALQLNLLSLLTNYIFVLLQFAYL